MQVDFYPTVADLNKGLLARRAEGRNTVAIKFITRKDPDTNQETEVFYLLHAPKSVHGTHPTFRKKEVI